MHGLTNPDGTPFRLAEDSVPVPRFPTIDDVDGVMRKIDSWPKWMARVFSDVLAERVAMPPRDGGLG